MVQIEPAGLEQPMDRLAIGLVIVDADRLEHAEGGDGVGEEEGRVVGGVERGADFGQRQHDAGGGFILHGADALDAVAGIGGERGAQGGEIDAAGPIGGHGFDVQAEGAAHLAPGFGEMPGLDHQQRVAGGEEVGHAGLPGAMA